LHFPSSPGLAGGSFVTHQSNRSWLFKVLLGLTDPPAEPEGDEQGRAFGGITTAGTNGSGVIAAFSVTTMLNW